MTKDGYKAFEGARARLAGFVGRRPRLVSDLDVVEYLARGDANTLVYLQDTGQLVVPFVPPEDDEGSVL